MRLQLLDHRRVQRLVYLSRDGILHRARDRLLHHGANRRSGEVRRDVGNVDPEQPAGLTLRQLRQLGIVGDVARVGLVSLVQLERLRLDPLVSGSVAPVVAHQAAPFPSTEAATSRTDSCASMIVRDACGS